MRKTTKMSELKKLVGGGFSLLAIMDSVAEIVKSIWRFDSSGTSPGISIIDSRLNFRKWILER
uniref:GATOR complex protein WDR24 n=1 Tax=Parascaris univalens TaxID=6257 RepID=A0A915C0Y5_PARUN